MGAIKCWDCNSRNNPPCGDRFDNYTVGLVDCDQRQDLVSHLDKQLGREVGKASICRKTVQTGEERNYQTRNVFRLQSEVNEGF